MAKIMLTTNPCPNCPPLPLKTVFQVLALCQTRTTLASTASAPCPIPGIDLCGMSSSSPSTPGPSLGELNPQPDPPILGELTLTPDDFRTYRAPLPPPHMVGSIDRPHSVYAGNQRSPYGIRAHNNDTRPQCTRCTRSQTAILAINGSSLLDHRMVNHSGFTASAASAASVPPFIRLLQSPPSARPGFTTADRTALHNVRPRYPDP